MGILNQVNHFRTSPSLLQKVCVLFNFFSLNFELIAFNESLLGIIEFPFMLPSKMFQFLFI